MPSLAILPANIPHEDYNITLVFNKDTIDPKRANNKVYGGDKWTPSYPTVNVFMDKEKLNKLYFNMMGFKRKQQV